MIDDSIQPPCVYKEDKLQHRPVDLGCDLVASVALHVLEGIALLFANIASLGLINLFVEVRREYSLLFAFFFSSEQRTASSHQPPTTSLSEEKLHSADEEEIERVVESIHPPSLSPLRTVEGECLYEDENAVSDEEEFESKLQLPDKAFKKYALEYIRRKKYNAKANRRRWDKLTAEEAHRLERENVVLFTKALISQLDGAEYASHREALQRLIDEAPFIIEETKPPESYLYEVKWKIFALCKTLHIDKLKALHLEFVEKKTSPSSIAEIFDLTVTYQILLLESPSIEETLCHEESRHKFFKRVVKFIASLFSEAPMNDANTYIEAIADKEWKNLSFYLAFLTRLDGGTPAEGLDFIDFIPDEATRYRALADFCLSLFDLGQKKRAVALAKTMPCDLIVSGECALRCDLLNELFKKLYSVDELDFAVEVAKEILFTKYRDNALSQTINSFIQKERSEEALALVDLLQQETGYKEIFLEELVKNFITEGRRENAIETVKNVTEASTRDELYREIVANFLKSDDVEMAIELTQKIESALGRGCCFDEIIEHLLESSRYQEVGSLISDLRDSYERERLFEIAFTSFLKEKELPELLSSIRLYQEKMSSDFLAKWIKTLLIEGFLEESFEAASSIADERMKASFFQELWHEYLESDDIEFAIDAADAMNAVLSEDSETYTSSIYCHLAKKLLATGDKQRALEVAMKISDVVSRCDCLEILFTSFFDELELEACVSIVKVLEELLLSTEGKMEKEEICSRLVPMLYMTDSKERALELLTTVRKRETKLELLSELSLLCMASKEFSLSEEYNNQSIELLFEKWDKWYGSSNDKGSSFFHLTSLLALIYGGLDKLFELVEKLVDDKSQIECLSLFCSMVDEVKVDLLRERVPFLNIEMLSRDVADDSYQLLLERSIGKGESEAVERNLKSNFFARSAAWLHNKKMYRLALVVANKIPDETAKEKTFKNLEEMGPISEESFDLFG